MTYMVTILESRGTTQSQDGVEFEWAETTHVVDADSIEVDGELYTFLKGEKVAAIFRREEVRQVISLDIGQKASEEARLYIQAMTESMRTR